jgi:hypothetical protein
MNPDKHELYKITWRQNYPEFEEAIDNAMDILLELSEYKEAKEVIERIMKL